MKDTSDSFLDKRAREIFLELLNIEESSERETFIETACKGNEELKKEVFELLEAKDQSEPLFEQNPYFQDMEVFADLVGSKIDRYEVLEKLGEGGFGEVFRVLQTDPIRRASSL